MPLLKLSLKTPSLERAIKRAGKKVTDRMVERRREQVRALVVDQLTAVAERSAGLPYKRFRAALRAEDAVKVTDRGVTVDIQDPVVQMVETGQRGFDIKQKMLAKAKKRSHRTGEPYVDVPFRHKAADVPRDITAEAKAKAAATGRDTVRVRRETPGRTFTRFLQRGVIGRALGLKPRAQQVQHARGIHDDMLRRRTGKGRGSYLTIRRMSRNSDPSSWWHPGFKGERVMLKAWDGLRRKIIDLIRGGK